MNFSIATASGTRICAACGFTIPRSGRSIVAGPPAEDLAFCEPCARAVVRGLIGCLARPARELVAASPAPPYDKIWSDPQFDEE
jgi:hypothetical protein